MEELMTSITRPTSPALDEILGQKFPVLDRGFVRVVDYMGNDDAIVQAARVSYGGGTKTPQEDANLIRYLMRHRHTSPFEMCEIKLHVKLPIFVARQWIRHRTANVNEVSGRYSLLPEEYYVPEEENILPQSNTNKQGREEGAKIMTSNSEVRELMDRGGTKAFELYNAFLEIGIARELSRIVLPVSTYTEWYWKIDLHNLFHFLKLRMDSHAQWEIRQYAEEIFKLVKLWVPVAAQAWLDYQHNSLTLSAKAASLIARKLAGEPVDHSISGLSNRELQELQAQLDKAKDKLQTPHLYLDGWFDAGRSQMTNKILPDLPPQTTSNDCYGFARWAGYVWKKALTAPTTRIGGHETYRQSHVLFTGGLPSETL